MPSRSTISTLFITRCAVGIILIASCTGLRGVDRKVYGSRKVVRDGRHLEAFTEVVLSEEGDLFIEIGDQNSLVIEAEDNLLEYLIAETVDNVLEIKKIPENVTLSATKPIRYFLTVKELESLTTKNSGSVEIKDMASDKFFVRILSSGSVHIGSLNTRLAQIELTSSGNLVIDAGEVDVQHVRLSSSGGYEGRNVACKTASVDLTSSGAAFLNVQEVLTVDISSSGDVHYIGNPEVVYIDASSTGRAKQLP